MKSTPLVVRYDSELKSVEAETLITSLSSLLNIVDEINLFLGASYNISPMLNVRLKAKLENYLDFIIEITTPGDLIIDSLYYESADYTDIVANTFMELIVLKKFLDGREPKEIWNTDNGIGIRNYEDKELSIGINTYKLHKENAEIGHALKTNFETLLDDSTIKSFGLIDKKTGKSFTLGSEDFAGFARRIKKVDKTHQIINIPYAKLFLRVIVERNIRLMFFYEGNKLNNVRLSDDVFISDIEGGRMIANGDQLIVEMDCFQEYDDMVKTFLNKSYEIIRVHEHVHKGKELTLFDFD
jgi:hypothetical protein